MPSAWAGRLSSRPWDTCGHRCCCSRAFGSTGGHQLPGGSSSQTGLLRLHKAEPVPTRTRLSPLSPCAPRVLRLRRPRPLGAPAGRGAGFLSVCRCSSRSVPRSKAVTLANKAIHVISASARGRVAGHGRGFSGHRARARDRHAICFFKTLAGTLVPVVVFTLWAQPSCSEAAPVSPPHATGPPS